MALLRASATPALTLALALFAHGARAQLSFDPTAQPASSPLTHPALNPGTTFLFGLEAKFAKDTAAGGGKAFASWFAEDAVTLSNGKAPVEGGAAIAAGANWDPARYQLTWTPEGGQLSPAGDMGFTWGHYEGTSKDHSGNPIVTKGRYMTIWKKQPDATWKVALDSSNDEPPEAGDCCKLP